MPCSQNCEQGRRCDCGDRSLDRATVVVVTLLFIAGFSMAYGLIQLFDGNTGQDCAVEVQFNDSKATYIGKTV